MLSAVLVGLWAPWKSPWFMGPKTGSHFKVWTRVKDKRAKIARKTKSHAGACDWFYWLITSWLELLDPSWRMGALRNSIGPET